MSNTFRKVETIFLPGDKKVFGHISEHDTRHYKDRDSDYGRPNSLWSLTIEEVAARLDKLWNEQAHD